MERGLLWLPLLILFIGLAWAGWNEYQKVETYQRWAAAFDRAKYDIYAVLGQQGDTLTWGIPTRKGIVETRQFSLRDVAAISLRVGDRTVAPSDLELISPGDLKGQPALEFQLKTTESSEIVPFTETALATQWAIALSKDLLNMQDPFPNMG